jgi:hypothetical protein
MRLAPAVLSSGSPCLRASVVGDLLQIGASLTQRARYHHWNGSVPETVTETELKDPSGLLGPSLYRSVDSNFVTKREDVLLRDRIEELSADMCPSQPTCTMFFPP